MRFYQKIRFIKGEKNHEKPIHRGKLPKECGEGGGAGGPWSVCRCKGGGVSKKSGSVSDEGLIPQLTLCTWQ